MGKITLIILLKKSKYTMTRIRTLYKRHPRGRGDHEFLGTSTMNEEGLVGNRSSRLVE